MNAGLAVAAVLALAFAVPAWRVLRRRGRAAIARVALAAASTVLLGLLLFPPEVEHAGIALRVLTPGTSADIDASVPGVALPGVDAAPGIERVPDLATALRRHPGVDALEIVGAGLPARDRDAARGHVLRFTPAEGPPGIVELDAPARVGAGSIWTLRGRVSGASRIELRDRADAVAALAAAGSDGRFVLEARAKGAGIARYSLRALDDDERVVEDIPLVVDVRAGERLRLVVLAGAPDGELKHLHRWADDAGLDVAARIALTRGIALREGEPHLDAGSLRTTDLAIVDERAWAGLAANEREALLDAVDGGLGLLLRAAGPLPAAVARDWAALGFRVKDADIERSIALVPPAAEGAPPPRLARRPLIVEGDGAVPLLSTAEGEPLALWRARGRGRIGLSWLVETYPLALAGDGARHGTLWSGIVSTLARARGTPPPQWQGRAVVDERAAVCGIGSEVSIERPDGSRQALAPDPTTPACAAYWPAEAGVHVLLDGKARWPFNVAAPGEARALAHQETTQATQALAAASTAAATVVHRAPGPRWPWFAAWFAISASLWWLERRQAPELR